MGGVERDGARARDDLAPPARVVLVTSVAIGARMPQRGSPASFVVVTVPSGSVIVVTPSCAVDGHVSAPDGSMIRLRTPPPGRYSARKRVSLAHVRGAHDLEAARRRLAPQLKGGAVLVGVREQPAGVGVVGEARPSCRARR